MLERRVVGTEGDGSRQKRNRFFRLPRLVQQDAEPMEGVGVIGVIADRLAVARLRLAEPAGAVVFEGDLEAVVGHGAG